MKNKYLYFLSTVIFLIIGCSSEPEWGTAYIDGKFTVADSLDDSGDYSDIQLFITFQENPDSSIDTLFNKSTNEKGEIKGKVKFPKKGIFPVFIKRYGTDIGATQFILADNDTLSFSGELPGLDQNFILESREHTAMNTFNRIDRGFKRVAGFINAGALEDSLIYNEIFKWNEIFWEVAQKNKGTLASNLSAAESVRLLNLIDQPLMMDRIDEVLEDEFNIFVGVNYGFPYVAEQKGIEKGVSYLDSLMELTEDENTLLSLTQKKIEAYYDSSRVDEAKANLEKFEKEFKDNLTAMEWAKDIGYDLAYLAPGYRTPDFSFITQEGDTVNSAILLGKPYILEITPVASQLYQDQYQRTVVIHQIYRNYGLEIFTIPLDRSEVTVNAFFEERVKHWSVAAFGSFDIKKLIETFNVTDVPTRILVDQNGNIVRKYVTTEFTDVIQGMSAIINKTKRES